VEPEREPGQFLESNHGRHLLAVVCLRVHARQLLARRRGGGAGGGELWRSAAAPAVASAAATVTAEPAALAAGPADDGWDVQ